jgi:hypothetical protein
MHFDATVLSSGGIFITVSLKCVISIADYHIMVVYVSEKNNKYSYIT